MLKEKFMSIHHDCDVDLTIRTLKPPIVALHQGLKTMTSSLYGSFLT